MVGISNNRDCSMLSRIYVIDMVVVTILEGIVTLVMGLIK